MARETGTAIYAEHDPSKMRTAVVREDIAKRRLQQVMDDETIEGMVAMDDATLETTLANMDAGTRRLAEDYLMQRDVRDGMEEALDEAHAPEVEAAESLVNSMLQPSGKVAVVVLGQYGDRTHEYGVVVNGLDANGNIISPDGQLMVVPLESVNWTPVYSSFNEGNAMSITVKGKKDISTIEPDAVLRTLLSDYEADANLLEQPAIEVGQNVLLADEEGNTVSAQVLSASLTGGWIIAEEGTAEPIDVTELELQEMMTNAEMMPILAEYAELDRQYERERKELQRQQEREAERAAKAAREAEEAARIAEEMKKPINRLAKYPEGHEKAGKPDYENSKPEDVRAYLIESLGLEGAVKSIRSQRTALEQQVAEKEAKLATLRSETESNDYFPDEAIAAREYIASEEAALKDIQKSLSYWKNVELITAGPTQEDASETIKRSVAAQKAAKTRKETYKPSAEYKKLQKQFADSQTALDILNDLEPHTPEELAAQLIAGGVRLMKADEKVGDATLKGVMSMTGYRQKDIQRMNFIFATRANGGLSVAEFGETLELAAKEAGIRFSGKVQEEGVNALLTLLGEVESEGDINRYIERRRMQEAADMYDAETTAIEEMKEAGAQQEYGMSYAELQELWGQMEAEIEERTGFYNKFRENKDFQDYIINFVENRTEVYGIEGTDNQGIAAGSTAAQEHGQPGMESGNGRNTVTAGSTPASAGMAEAGKPDKDLPGRPGNVAGTDGRADGAPVSDGQESAVAERAARIEAKRQEIKAAADEVKTSVQGRPVRIFSSKEEIQALAKKHVSEDIINEALEEMDKPGIIAYYQPDINEIFFFANKAEAEGVPSNRIRALIYHENVHTLSRNNRYSPEEFKRYADMLRKAFPDIAEFVEKHYNADENAMDEEVVTGYLEGLFAQADYKDVLAGTAEYEGETAEMVQERNHIINLLKDRNYERKAETGSDGQTILRSEESGDRETGDLGRTGAQGSDGSPQQESVPSVGGQGRLGNGQESGLAGQSGLLGQTGGTVRTEGYRVEKRYHAKQNKDIYAVNFEERFDREKFLELKKVAKEFGGYYSSFGKKGFIFNSEEDARKFGNSVTGAVEAAESTAGIEQRINVLDNDWTESGEYGEVQKRTVIVDGKYEVTQVDEPDSKGLYTGSYYTFDGKEFGDLPELVYYIDSRLKEGKQLKEKGGIAGLEQYTEGEVYSVVREHIAQALEGEDVRIKGMQIIGSRVNGNANEDSDLDVLVEFEGDMREDSFFNAVNEEGNKLYIEGVAVDINPITAGKSGTIDQWLKRNAGYQKDIEQARAAVNTDPSEAQKEAGNYKMGHVKLDGYDITIENPKGSVRKGTDKNGTSWSISMNNDYGYIRGTEAVDGDHIDVFLSDNPGTGNVFVVDQLNEDGSFDESKVMYGFNSLEEAKAAYLANYSEGWENRIMAITEVSKDEFRKWVDSSHRKTKAFSEYKSVKPETPSSDIDKIKMPKEYHGGDKVFSIKHNENKDILMAMHSGEEVKYMFTDGTSAMANEVKDAVPEKKNNEPKITYNEQGGRTIESQADHSAGKAEKLGDQTTAIEDGTRTGDGRGTGTPGNRGTGTSGSTGTSQQSNGYRIGEKVLYRGKDATIFDIDNGRPVLDTGLAPVLYEVGEWSDVQKLPTTVEQINSIAAASKPGKKLERAKERQKKAAPKRQEKREQMADLFGQVDKLDEQLTRQEQEVDAELALLSEYKAGPKAQVREDMHTGAAKTLEKAARKFAKNLASRLGGHVDGKDISRGLTNIAPIGGDMHIRIWMDDAETTGVMLNLNFDAVPDTDAFDKLETKGGYWRTISKEDPYGTRSSNRHLAPFGKEELESGAAMKRVADAMAEEINRMVAKEPKSTEVLTNKEKQDERRIEETNRELGTEAREEAEGPERGRDDRGLHGNNVPDTDGSGRVSGRDSGQQPSLSDAKEPVAATETAQPAPATTNSVPPTTTKRNQNNFSYGDSHLELPTGEIGKLKGNIEAIRILKELEASGQPATAEQKDKLRMFVGWGGLAEALNEFEYDRWQRDSKLGYGSYNPWGKKWGKHFEELRPLLTDEELAQAQASTLNSHYTPEPVIRGLWAALEYIGFRGGRILEPAMGIGHIIGFMPKGISEVSQISGFELDSIPGRIAKLLYPDAMIQVAGYETAFRPNSKDGVVTNVPFGQTAPIDPALDKALRRKVGGAYNLHNYFIIKGLLELKPGGVGAFITSAATMDGRNTKAREYIASIGVDLIGAIRLPNNTFSKNAGTEVTADILFFRKRLPGEQSNGVNFISLSQVGTGTYMGINKKNEKEQMEVPLLVNEYFAQHPEMMLGTIMTAHDAGSGGLYGGDSQTLVPKPGSDLAGELMDAIERLPEDVLTGTMDAVQASTAKEATTQKNGRLSVKNGKVYVAHEGQLEEIAPGTFKHNGKTRKYADAAEDYIALKETLKELIKAEQTQKEDPTELRKKLNQQYDSFVEKYGQLNENKALNTILEEDFERYLPQSLEKVTTVTNPKTGRRSKTVSKGTGILAQRVSRPMMEPEKAENLQDAIDISQAYHGRMDVDYIARMLGKTTDETREQILQERQAYEDPVTGDLIDKDAYLSGNVREKLEQAREAAAVDARYEQNVRDLEESMPEAIPFIDISYKIGTPWIPEDIYEDFAREVLGIEGITIKYVPAADEFMTSGGYVRDYTKANDFNTKEVATVDLFNNAINLRKPTVWKKVDKDRRVKDEAATQDAVARIMDMNDAFIRYIQEKEDIHTRLQNIYNDRYNNYRLREYRTPNFTKDEKGEIHYPGSNSGITLREHQVKAVQRSLQGSTLLAHQVGTGKTFTMITTAMEMRRLGLAKKPMIVVQNATLNDFAADFLKLYPAANILVPNETERSAGQRKRLFNLIATGDFDAIIVPQSFLAFIPDDEGRKKALIKARVEEILAAAEALAETDSRLANRLKREAMALEESLSEEVSGTATRGKKLSVKKQAKKEESAISRETQKLDRRTDDVLTFEQMGVDALFIDEAHNFKKIGFSTKMQNVKGVDTGFSERANSLYLKASFVQERNGGRNVILATGTPITNTMAEVWTMMRFVAPEILEDYNIKTFDEFAATFGQVEPSLEQNSTGGFKIADRFKSYVNVPELIKAFRSHADVVLTSDVPEFKESKSIPKLKDGKMTNHVIQKSEELSDVMDVLVEALKKDEEKSGKDKTPGLPLVVFSKAKQAAIDLRLINPEFPDDPNSKTNKVVSEVMRIYKESTPDKGVQMIFCDSYQSPGSEPAIDLFGYDESVPRFNLYRDIKEKLVKEGVPKEQIVIVSEISNADRKKAVFEKARAGEVRILIGGTEKMGVGVNVQDRMIALHHMDAPIRPMDFEQRNGRILRQGNMYAERDMPVEVLTYGVEGTLDATAYERLRIKQDFINQMMKGDVSGRVMEESDDEDPSGKTFSQMAAELSGDKTLQLLFVAENNLKKLEGLKRSAEIKREYAKAEIPLTKASIRQQKELLREAEEAAAAVAQEMPNGIERLTMNGHTFNEKLAKVITETVAQYEEQYALNRGMLPLTVKLNGGIGEMVFHHNQGQLVYSMYVDGNAIVENKEVNTFSGIWMSANSALGGLNKRVQDRKERVANQENKLKGLESVSQKGFDKEEELKAARQEVKKLKQELENKAKEAANKVANSDLKQSIKNLKNGEKPISLPEEMAGDSEESLDRMDTAINEMREVAVNAPQSVSALTPRDILNGMPELSIMQYAKVLTEAKRPDVKAIYVPWTKQIVLLPKHGTVKEMQVANWHESFHFAMDMILPQGDEGRLIKARAASEVDKISPALSKWVEDTYNSNVDEEKLTHVLEEVISYMIDKGRMKAIRGGLDFGSQYPVLNEVANKIINYLTNNGYGKESTDYSGYDGGNQPANRTEGEGRENGQDFPSVFNGQAQGREEIINRAKANGTYMMAPNGKPSKLDEYQWVQVRAKAFKNWYGDWERLAMYNPIRKVSTVSEAMKYVEELFNKPITNRKFNFTATITKNKAGKLQSEKATRQSVSARLHAMAVANIDRLFENAEVRTIHEDTKNNPDILSVHRLGSIMYDEESKTFVPVKITAFEYNTNTGNRIYSIEAIDIEGIKKSAGQLEDGSRENPRSPIADFNTKINNLIESANDLKRKTSKVVDENGEPMVVYHGTGSDFNIFGDYKEYDGNSFWFAENEAYSEEFTSYGGDKPHILHTFLNIKNPYDLRTNPLEGFPIIKKEMAGKEEYAAVEDIERLSDILGISPDAIWEEYDGYNIWTVTQSKRFADALMKKGYDGIMFEEEMEATWGAFKPNQIKSATDNVGTFSPENDDIRFSVRQKPAPRKTGIGYKVFFLKDGKLYPPMVANPDGADTPVGVWLDADAAPVVAQSKTGRDKVKAGGKGTQGGSGTLAYRPGWHLGEIPYAIQFNRKNPETGEKELFPKNFVWAEVEYANDKDYQDEAMSYGYNAAGNFQHSLAGLPKLPTDGAYRYRTNPNPETDPWVITGAMKVNRILRPSEVDAMVTAAGREPQKRENGALTDADIEMLNAQISMQEPDVMLSLRGKPRRKQGESLVAFNRRLKEWQAQVDEAKRTRAVEDMDITNPIDEELNDLTMEMMNHPTPIRKKGESEEDFNARQAEWSEWYNNRLPQISQRMSELKAELEQQKANARRREMKEVDEHLMDGTIPPQKDNDPTGERLTDEEMREVREIFKEKMNDMKISISKEQIRKDIKQEIIERRRYIETSNLEDTFFVDEVKKAAGNSKEVLAAIPDYIEGTYTGMETPELKKAAKMVSDWFEEVYNIMAQEGVLYDAPKIQNYVTHIWDWKRTPKEAQERYSNWVNTMRLRSPFTKHRVIPSYKEGIAMGMVPKYDDITGIILEYGHYASETIANKRMINFLMNFEVMIEGGPDNLPMNMPVIMPDKVKDPMYSRMNHTALDGYKVLNAIKPFITPVFGDQRIIDPSQLDPFTNKLIDGIWTTSSAMKKIALSFSFFHHGALTETAIAMMKPHHAAKVIAKNLIWDVITKGSIPAINNKEAARDAVKHLVSLGASNDYVTADVNNLTTRLHQFTVDKNIPVAKQAAKLLDFLNKGSDKFLWDTIHDGFKIASFEKLAKEIRNRAEREGWSQMDTEKALDEAGHLINDTYGGLHFDILGFSPKTVRFMRALLLSPDWTLATTRQALSVFGFGQLYNSDRFWKNLDSKTPAAKTRKKYGRQFWLTAGIFFYALMNGLNAYFRAKDEDEQNRIADDMRQIHPEYKSPYELAYPDGMKWYDYTMAGNTLGHQTHLFTGRYEEGTETYARWGKQFREVPELFFSRDAFSFPGPMFDKIAGKVNPLVATTFEFISGHGLNGWENEYMKDKKGWEREVGRLHLLASKLLPYSVPTQEDKDFYWLDLVMPSSKGFSPGKAINYFEVAIKSGDMDYVAAVYSACVMNGLDPEKYFKVAGARIEAEAKQNLIEGVETLQDATKRFDEATDLKERKRLLRYIEQQVGAQDFNAISQEEMVNKAKDFLNGEMVDVTASDIYLEYATSEDVLEDYRMKKNAAGLKKYYQDYVELGNKDAAAAARMLQDKRKFIEGYSVTTRYRNAMNKLKKALSDDRNQDKGRTLNDIRRLRKEYFDKMQQLEFK